MSTQHIPPEVDERTVFRVVSDGTTGSALWVDGVEEKMTEFEFRVTNIRVVVESERTGEISLPLPLLDTIETNVEEFIPDDANRRLRLYGAGAVAGLLGCGYLIASHPEGSLFIGAFWVVIGLYILKRVANGVRAASTGEYRQFGFTRGDRPAESVALRGLREEPGPDGRDIFVQFPADEFSSSNMAHIGDLPSPLELDLPTKYALPTGLFGKLGVPVSPPAAASVNDMLSGGSSTGGTVGFSQYECENCGTLLNIESDVNQSGRAYTCGNCGHELDDQQEAIGQAWMTDGVLEDEWDG